MLTADRKRCVGCKVCSLVCPVNCINMKENTEGFLYPEADESKCIHCGWCNKNCAYQSKGYPLNDKPEYWAVKNKKDKVRWESSGGGFFTALAESIIDRKGIVFGAAFDSCNKVVHEETDKKEELGRFRKSKYVQSDLQHTFQRISRCLEQGKEVLFTGTPCQVKALKLYLKSDYENLYTMDVICTGVSSPLVFHRYLEELEKDKKQKIKRIIFREKSRQDNVLNHGMRNLTIKVIFNDGSEVYENNTRNPFFEGFLQRLFLRESCHHCPARAFSSGSDFQVGDFWGIETMYPEFCDKTESGENIPFGVSMVIVKTLKGKRRFHKLEGYLDFIQADRSVIREQDKYGNWHLLYRDFPPHVNRNVFFAELQQGVGVTELIERRVLTHQFPFDRKDKRKIGLVGSYNTREVIRQLTAGSNLELEFQFRNSNVISIMSENPEFPTRIHYSSNEFRKSMLIYDCTKEFISNIGNYCNGIDVLLIDLLEERYPSIETAQGKYITKSSAFMETQGISGRVVIEKEWEIWQKSCLEFIRVLKRKLKNKPVILLELYLCEMYGVEVEKKRYRNDKEVRRINKKLRRRYQFFKEHMAGIQMINMEDYPAAVFTDQYHTYGCLPEHLNYMAYRILADKVYQLLRKKGL